MQLYRVVINWTGAPVVGNAVTVLHYDGSNQSAPPIAGLKSAFSQYAALFSNNVTLTFPSSGDTIEDTTGHLTGTWSSTGGGQVAGTMAQTSAAGVGACIGWTTGGIVSGKKGPRRLRGRTFLVPIAKNAFDADGTLDPVVLQTIQNLAAGIMASGPLAVWHRPTKLAPAGGSSYAVLSSTVHDKVAFLSSRRD